MAEQAQAGGVAGPRELLFGEGGEHGRHQQGRRDPVALDEVKRGRGIKHREHDLTAAVPHRGQHRDRARGVKQWRGNQPAGVGPERELGLEVKGVGDEVAVGEDHALGGAGGPAGVEQAGHGLWEQFVGELARRRPGQQGFVAVFEVDDALHDAGWIVDARGDEQHACAGVLQRIGQLGRRMALVERDQRHARSGHRLIELEVAVAVAPHHGHSVAVANPHRAQRAHQPARPVPRLGVGDLDVAAPRGDGVGRRTHGAPQRVDHRGHRCAPSVRPSVRVRSPSGCGGPPGARTRGCRCPLPAP